MKNAKILEFAVDLEPSTNIETAPKASEAAKKSTVLFWVGQVFDLRLTPWSAS